MPLIDPHHPLFKSAWRRYLLVIAPFAWAGVELTNNNVTWAMLFGAIGVYIAWVLILPRKE